VYWRRSGVLLFSKDDHHGSSSQMPKTGRSSAIYSRPLSGNITSESGDGPWETDCVLKAKDAMESGCTGTDLVSCYFLRMIINGSSRFIIPDAKDWKILSHIQQTVIREHHVRKRRFLGNGLCFEG
jgi:hypothetical protein